MNRPVLDFADVLYPGLRDKRASECTPEESIVAGIAWMADNSEYGIDDAGRKLIDEFRAFVSARSETAPKPQCSYEPLSIMAIEGNQNWLRETLPAKFHDFYDKLVKMAINCVLYAEEIQRLRDTPRSATRQSILREVAMNYVAADKPVFEKWLHKEIGDE